MFPKQLGLRKGGIAVSIRKHTNIDLECNLCLRPLNYIASMIPNHNSRDG